MQLALNTKLHAFEYIKRDPELARLFKSAVLSQEHVRRAHWEDPDFYPVQDRLLSGLRDDGVVMVDVGGGIGLDCERPPATFTMPEQPRKRKKKVSTSLLIR